MLASIESLRTSRRLAGMVGTATQLMAVASLLDVTAVAQTPQPAAGDVKARRSFADLFRDPAPQAVPITPAQAWYQTNQPPSNLTSGPQLGTDVFGEMTPAAAVVPASFVGRPVLDVPPALRWGPVTAHPHLSYGLSYGDGLLASRGEKEDTLYHTVTPGIQLDLGKHWIVDYSPRLVFYDSELFRDTLNHDVRLQGFGQRGDWDLNLSNTFAANDSSLVETGRQTEQTMNSTHLGATHPLGPKWMLDLGVSQNFRWTGDFNNTLSWSTLDSLRYNLRPQMDVGVSLGMGYDMVDPGTDMLNEQLMGNIRGAIGNKFNYKVSGGLEFRQFVDTDAGTEVSPIFDASLGYELTSTTLVTAHFTEQVTPSFFNDQFTTSTVVEGTVSQRLLGKFNLGLTGGYRWADYKSTVNPGEVVRTANYEFLRVSLGARFLNRGTASIYFLWSNNDSTIEALSFSSHQFGLQLTYGF